MKRRNIHQALIACAVPFLLFVTGCTTVETRIQERPQAYQNLSPRDQAMVQQGRIREGFSQDAVYIAWGPPSQQVPGRYNGRIVETWIYDSTTAGDYGGPFYYGSPYGYGVGFGYYGGRRGRLGRYGGFYDPFYDPFFYRGANIVRYPDRTVTFQNGRVIALQFLPPPRIY